MEDPFFSRKTIPSLPHTWYRRKKQPGCQFFLRRKGLLSGWLSNLAAVPRCLSHSKATARWHRSSLRLFLGGNPPDQTACLPRANALSSARADGEVKSYLPQPAPVKETRSEERRV